MPPQYCFATPTESTPFLEESALIKKNHPIGVAHVLVYHSTMLLYDLRFVPENFAHRPLHLPDARLLHTEGDGLYGFPLQFTQLANHVAKETLLRFNSREAIPEFLVESFELLKKTVHILSRYLKLGDCKQISFDPTIR